MSVLVYGIALSDGRNGFGTGLEGEPLRGVAEGPLLAILSNHEGSGPAPQLDTLSAYERIVRELMDGGAILPARFGTVVADDAAVRALLRGRRRDLLARVQRVRGAVEIALRASWRDGLGFKPDARPPSGTSYMRERLELRQRACRVATQLGALGALSRSTRRALIPRPDLPVLDAYLVDRERVQEFVAMVEQLDHRMDEVELVCTGPWPPYSFAEGAPV
jgi:Gas vesicle synthesis protein GvpL/GvpF